jgi:hypothetical protein
MVSKRNPDSWRIEIAPRLRSYDTYRALEKAPLLVPEAKLPDRELLAEH